MDDNGLTALPVSLRQLQQLERLYLHGNEKLGLPDEVLRSPWRDATIQGLKRARGLRHLEFYFKARAGRRPLNEAKLILVGRGAVGKTSLVKRLLNDRFDRRERKTDGIRITDWPLRLNDKEDVQLHVWDFGGQEIMHATHQFFLTHRSLYLLVLNGREGGEDADAEYWLKLIESFGADSPVIVVLNKFNEQPFDLNRRQLQRKYPAIRDFIATDCEDGTGIPALRKAIERETDRLEHLRDPFPASWFSIKDALSKMKKNFMAFDEYCGLCAKRGEKETAAQEALAGHLHNLGVALNYKDDPRLRDMHVLNPHWVTNGIYTILNSKKLSEQKGVLHLKDIAGILDVKKYPAKMHGFLLDLMRKFDLCFRFPVNEERYLVPELLAKQQPPEADAFRAEQCLNFQFHYPVLPEGILPRFIVRTHPMSRDLPRWRTGVILKFDENQALVRADVQDRKVFISIWGPVRGRRELLAIIRAHFEDIHGDIAKLAPEAMVPLPDHPETVVPYDDLLTRERGGETEFTVAVGGTLVKVSVRALLDGVDIEGARKVEGRPAPYGETVRVFYSYAHKDDEFRDELDVHLKLLQRQGVIEAWSDRRIGPGDEWKEAIDTNLERADIILLLVSSDFMASDYCYDKEMTRALERYHAKEAKVIPIVLRDCDWESAPFGRLQALPQRGRPVKLWPDRDSAWKNVAQEIRKEAEKIKSRSRPKRF